MPPVCRFKSPGVRETLLCPLAPTYTVTLTLTMNPDAICVQGAASSHSRQGAVTALS